MLKLLLKNRFLFLMDKLTGQKKGKKVPTAAILALITAGFIALLVGAGYLLSWLLGPLFDGFSKAGLIWLYYAIAGTIALFGAFVFTFTYAQGAIYEADDNELLLSMPIRPSVILASRIWSLFFLNLLICVIVMGAAGIVAFLQGGSGVGNLLIVFLCAVLLAMLSTALAALLGWFTSFLTRRMRKKVLFQVIIYMMFVVLIYYVSNGITEHVQTMIRNSGDIAKAFRNGVFPLYAMGTAAADLDMVLLLIFAACCVLPFVVMYILLSHSFIRIVTARSGMKKRKYKAKALKGSSVVWALTKKDMRRMLDSSTYLLNACMGVFYFIAICVISVVSGRSSIFDLLTGTGPDMPFAAAAIISMTAGFIFLSGSSISVEGKNFWILKSLPVKWADVMKSKLLFHLLPAVPFSLLFSLAVVIIASVKSVMGILILFLMPLCFHVLCALIGLILNLFTGRLDYPSLAKAVKSTRSQLIPMGIILVLSIGSLLLHMIFFKDRGISMQNYMLAVTALIVLIDVILYAFLNSRAANRRWEKLGN